MINKKIAIELTELEQALLGRTRRTFEFEFKDYIGGTKLPLGKIRIRVATVEEQEQALIAAHEYIVRKTKENKSSPSMEAATNAASDYDFINNVKAAFILHKVCLHPTADRVIFSGPEAMMKAMSVDELAKVFEYYQAVLKEFSPFDLELTEEKVEAIAEACAATAETDAPNIVLSHWTTAQKAELIIRLSQKLAQLKKQIGERSAPEVLHAN